MGRAAAQEVRAGLGQAQFAIHGQPGYGGILVVLPVVLPPADRAQLLRAGRFQRPVPAAKATETSLFGSPHERMDGEGERRVTWPMKTEAKNTTSPSAVMAGLLRLPFFFAM
jgi:hypothetical protein